MQIQNRLMQIRQMMNRYQMNAYVIVSGDFHGSEYVGDFFKTREFMSGFTGSAGTLVILKDRAALWTDGRYYLQAEAQLRDSTITLMRDGQSDTPKLTEYLSENVPAYGVIGFDGRTVNYAFFEQILRATRDKDIRFVGEHDLVGEIWKERPAMSASTVWELPYDYAGESRKDKLAAIRTDMRGQSADVCVLTALDEIAWLLNLRGADVAYSPVFLSYMMITQKKAILYVNPAQIPDTVRAHLAEDGISIAGYEQIYEDVRILRPSCRVWADAKSMNYKLMIRMPQAVQLQLLQSPVQKRKAVKNQTEMQNMKKAHIRDGVAVTHFLYWLKTHIEHEVITEMSAAQKLLEFRQAQEGFLDQSFSPIFGYGAHGAIVHYEATPQTDIRMMPEGFCLADTGAHYLDGTTDITRTIVLGPLTQEEKKAYTLVLRGHLHLADAHFPYGLCGQNLDYIAREPLWENGLDFLHGTGHGVGYLLNVHEGPQNINWRINRERPAVPLEEGMVTSDEPGLYIAGKFGIRHENLLLCVKDRQTEYGQFMKFETLTMVPFDIAGIDMRLMTDRDMERLNAYHKQVYDTISPYFEGEELAWLRDATMPVTR